MTWFWVMTELSLCVVLAVAVPCAVVLLCLYAAWNIPSLTPQKWRQRALDVRLAVLTCVCCWVVLFPNATVNHYRTAQYAVFAAAGGEGILEKVYHVR